MIVKKNWFTRGNLIRALLIGFALAFIVSQIRWSHPIYSDLIILYVG